MNTNLNRRNIISGATVLAANLLVPNAFAQSKTISITLATGHPPVISWVKVLNDFFIPEVQKRALALNVNIAWNKAFGGTVAKIGGELEAVEKNIADMSIVGSVFHPAKLSLLNVAYFAPFAADTVKNAVETVDAMYDKVPAMKKLWEQANQVYLCGIGTDQVQLFTKTPVRRLSDLKGMKIGGAGPNLNWLKGSGATGVVVSPPTIYNDIQNGVYEGVLLSGAQAVSLKINEVTPYMLKINFGALYWAGLTINKQTFSAMSSPLQKVFKEVALEYRAKLFVEQDRIASTGLEAMKANGMRETIVSSTERIGWASSLPDIAGEWVTPLEAKGQPAKQVLQLWMDGLRGKGSAIGRNWDRA